MSSEAKAKGTLRFESEEVLDGVLEELDDGDEDGDLAEVLEAVRDGMTRDGLALTLDIDVHLTNSGNLEFQEWLGDLAESAASGHLDTWQEDFGDSMFVRLTAGGEEREMPGAFPT